MTSRIGLDVSLANIWRSWYAFRRGKRKTLELETFSYHLEANLYKLYEDIANGRYKHGPYKKFTVCDNKKREIRVASIRDRVVHRLLYDYLVALCDHTFIYDVWSCREDKGLIGAITRSQQYLSSNPHVYIWRADISKFFDNVDQSVLWSILARKVKDRSALTLLKEIIASYLRERERERERRTPFGRVTGFSPGNADWQPYESNLGEYLP